MTTEKLFIDYGICNPLITSQLTVNIVTKKKCMKFRGLWFYQKFLRTVKKIVYACDKTCSTD